MANEDVLIKVAADIQQAVQGMNQIVQQMGEVVKAVTDTNKVAEDGEKTAKSFWETWLTGANQTGASAVAWGQQMSQAFDALKDGVKDAITALPNMVAHSAAVGDELFTMANQLDTTAARLGELKYISGQTGASMEGMARTTQMLGVTLNDVGSNGAKAIEKLGLNLSDLASKDKTEAMFEIIQRIKDVVPAAQQSATMLEVFGGKARGLTMLLKEDISGLRESYKQLGMSADDLNKLAVEGDRYADNLENIKTVQEAWKNSIANALLPTINDLLETMPGLGGAVLTLGEGFLSTASNMLPILSNIAMLKSSGLAATMASWAASIPGVTTAMGAASSAAGVLAAAMGPLAIAIGGVTAAWFAWKAASKESGWIREISDGFQYAALRVMGYSAAESDAMIATDHATQKAREAAEAQKAHGQAVGQTAAALPKLGSGLDQLSAKTKEVNAAYNSLTAAQKAQIKAAIDAGTSTKDIADLLAGDMKVSATVAQQAIDKFKTSLQQTKKEAEKSPFQKLAEDAKNLGKSVSEASAQGVPLTQMLEQFGKQAADMVTKAAGMKNGLAQIPPEVKKLADEWRNAQLNEKLKDLTEKANDLAKAFSEKVAAGAQAASQAITKMSQEMTLNMLSGSEKRLKQIEFEEQAAIQSIQKQSSELDKSLDDQISKIKKNFDDRRKAEQQFAEAGKGVSAEKLAQIDAEEKAAIDAARAQVDATKSQYAEQTTATRQYYDQKRAFETKSTGDFEKDAELRGVKTKQVYDDELAKQRETLAFMEANRDQFTKADIKKQEQIVEAAEVAAGKVKSDWSGAIESLTQAFEQLANISGNAFGGIVKGVGEVIGSVNVMTKGLQTAFGEKGIGGIGAAFSQAKGSAGGFMGIFKGIAGSIPMIGTAISGIVSAASAAVKVGKKLWDAFTKSGGEKAAKEVGRDFGVKISEEMGDAFNKTAKELFKGDRFAANIYHMADIVKEAGGISEKNFSQMLKRLHDVFSMVETGKFTVEQATKVLDENFGAFADHVLKSGKVASKEFTEIIALNARFGTQSKQIMDFVAGQTTRLGGALATLAGAQDQTNESMGRFERLAVAGFNAAIAAGVPYLDAIEQMGPALDKIVEQNKKLGREGGAAIQELLKFREVANANKDLVESAGALNEVMLALSNTGALNAETMADLQAQGTETFDKLVAAGFTEQQALQQMKGFLEQVRTAHTELGLPIDANTQKLLDQATAQGVLKAEQMSTNDIMLQGLGAIIEALGGKLPEAFQKMKDAGVDAANAVKGSTDETTAAMQQQSGVLGATPWTQYAGRGVAAGSMAAGAMSGVNNAVSSVDGMLNSTDWSGWSEEAVSAAQAAQDAIESVSFGNSPGGIKEIPIQLKKAMAAVDDWKKTTVDSAQVAQESLEKIGMNPDLGKVGAAATEASVVNSPAVAGDNVAMNVSINTIDASNMDAAVEQKMIPSLVKALRKGGRGVNDIQGVLR